MEKTETEKANLIAKIAFEKKGTDIVLLDMHEASDFCDYFVLISAGSSRRVKTISKAIQEELSKKKIHPFHVEGRHNPYWVLLDYVDTIVHIFHKDVRDFYSLERLWSDVPRLDIDEKCTQKTFQKKSKRS